MTTKEPFNIKQLSWIDASLRTLVDAQYDFCLYKCTEKTTLGMEPCKSSCVTNVIVPYRFANHAGRDQEENQYRKCLAQRFPNISADDYQECTKAIYKDRVKVLSDHFVNVYEDVLTTIRH